MVRRIAYVVRETVTKNDLSQCCCSEVRDEGLAPVERKRNGRKDERGKEGARVSYGEGELRAQDPSLGLA